MNRARLMVICASTLMLMASCSPPLVHSSGGFAPMLGTLDFGDIFLLCGSMSLKAVEMHAKSESELLALPGQRWDFGPESPCGHDDLMSRATGYSLIGFSERPSTAEEDAITAYPIPVDADFAQLCEDLKGDLAGSPPRKRRETEVLSFYYGPSPMLGGRAVRLDLSACRQAGHPEIEIICEFASIVPAGRLCIEPEPAAPEPGQR